MSLKEIRNFDYAVLLYDNIKETRRFYEDVMGFPLAHDSEDWVSFQVGATLLTLRPRGPFMTWNDGPSSPGSTEVQLAFRVPPSAIDTCHAELVEHGVPILREPTDLPAWRHRTIFFRDPEENIVEIYAEY